ncbi:MAG: peroxidase-related enzyme [Armatimonas sp.]
MTWIETVAPSEETPELNHALQTVRGQLPITYARRDLWEQPQAVLNDSIVLAHSLIPLAAEHALATWGALCQPDLPLSRREQEIIATVVSAANECFYCRESHTDFLRLETTDGDFARAVRDDWRTAPGLNERELALCAYAEKLTKTPSRVVKKDLETLRAVGLDDTGILHANLCASFFNYINRVANGLGVGRDGEEGVHS